MRERVDEEVDGLLFHLVVIQSNAQIGCQVQLAGQIAKYALEEGVDGLDAEVAVVVKQLMECLASLTADL